MTIEALRAYANAAARHRHASDLVELDQLSREGRRRPSRQWRMSVDGALELVLLGKVVVSCRRRLFGRLLNRVRLRFGWHSRRQQLATNAFIAALTAHAKDEALARKLLEEAGVRPNRAISARQVLRVVMEFEPEVVHRMTFDDAPLEAALQPRQWHYARQVVMKLKANLKR